MTKLRVMSVFGTRPDTIKMAPVVRALHLHPQIDDLVCVTAQHRKMLDDLLATLRDRSRITISTS